MGYFSYAVPEFKWTHFDGLNADALNKFDIVIQEDAGPKRYAGLHKPLVYVVIDSTLSEGHLESRLQRAKNADLILVDHDSLDRFTHLGKPVRRWNYCVNDRLMRDYESKRDIDVSFYCGSNEERGRLRNMLRAYYKERGLNFATGTLNIVDYARAMAQSKIVVNWPRVPGNRPHRVFDALSCGACLVTGPIPAISGDERVPGRDYVEVKHLDDIPTVCDYLLDSGEWQERARWGKRLVAKYHAWSMRARQLRVILQEELGIA
jgi:spore maturation protein CgeB